MLSEKESTQLEFNAYELINKFVNGDYWLFTINKLKNGYNLENTEYHFKVIKEDICYYLVVVIGEKEYFFDGKNEKSPFRCSRNYNGEWQIYFETILENTV
ncbi:hypothetical protein [Epilithonimonas xixisoli]|uniref:Uncharacterized protein n=1 Tax=Epilithonimonas xixisoli TaxID=1476462 RepID=A0A4R8IAJ6_9FLAO|nr:hypothetical protein [Epilithonimonas xixisoli]TDX87142.1 hypothetical protein B0I22_1323 [Epilithonimonas xixisoli]